MPGYQWREEKNRSNDEQHDCADEKEFAPRRGGDRTAR